MSTIPESLSEHLDQQQRAAYTIEALLEWSLERVIQLVHQLGTELDGATVAKVCAAPAVQP